jgi:hypothetical protein
MTGTETAARPGGAHRASTARRFGCLVLVGALAVAGWLGYAALRREIARQRAVTGCQVSAAGTSVDLDAGQAADAATIAAVALRRGLPERAVVVALAAAIQESKLEDLRYGDRDSVGVFQQRPSQGYADRTRLLDPAYAAGAFYDRLVTVPRYQNLSVADAAQAVQRSADGSAYADQVDQATALAAAFTGQAGAPVVCSVKDPDTAGQRPGADGLTPRARAVEDAVARDFGPLVRVSGRGATLDLVLAGPAGPAGPAVGQDSGWALARWAVAQAASLDIHEVTYAGSRWISRGWAPRWRPTSVRLPGRVRVEVP